MPTRTVLGVTLLEESDDGINAAAEFCTEAGAHLSMVVIGLAVPPPMGDFDVLTAEWHEMRRRNIDAVADRAARAREILTRYGISFDVGTEYAEPAWLDDAIGLRARCCDLVYVHRNVLAAEDAVVPLMQGCLFQSARPALIVPAGIKATLEPENVMIAWDSRLESARAVSNALEIMSKAKHVHIAIVDPIASDAVDGAEPGADIAAYLARHGLAVTVDQLAGGGRPVADVLKQHATDIGADLIVMGAYSHSRLRERIFGGVTRSFIEGAKLPVLMAH
jgi:nucleotide-binding universal stress UspA family protein